MLFQHHKIHAANEVIFSNRSHRKPRLKYFS